VSRQPEAKLSLYLEDKPKRFKSILERIRLKRKGKGGPKDKA
jgi:hypothetical protein